MDGGGSKNISLALFLGGQQWFVRGWKEALRKWEKSKNTTACKQEEKGKKNPSSYQPTNNAIPIRVLTFFQPPSFLPHSSAMPQLGHTFFPEGGDPHLVPIILATLPSPCFPISGARKEKVTLAALRSAYTTTTKPLRNIKVATKTGEEIGKRFSLFKAY